MVGASGGIGAAFCEHLQGSDAVARLFRLSRAPAGQEDDWLPLDLADEAAIAAAAKTIRDEVGSLHLVIVATGILHDRDAIQPEKTWRALDGPVLEKVFRINAIGPALVAKHFLPLLARDRKSAFAALSARVGSISDNGLGGWYAYRSSKAALNMMVRTFAIELARKNGHAICVALHPGTVETGLSAPFRSNVPGDKLFSPERSAGYLLDVLDGLDADDSGGLFAWDGAEIPF